MNVLIISNSSYIETIALISVGYIFNNSENNYCLLSETHDSTEKEIVNNTRIKIYRNIVEAIHSCDITLLYSTEYSSQKKEMRIENLCAQYNRRLYKFVFSEKMARIKQPEDLSEAFQLPTILTLSIGKYHYQHRTELIINDIFKKENIGIKQTFSDLSYGLCNEYINALGIEIQKNTDAPMVQVVSQSYNSFNDLVLDDALHSKFAMTKPAVVIVDVESSFPCVQELSNLFKYKYSCEIDLIIRSNYAQIASNTKGVNKPIYYCAENECISSNQYIDCRNIYDSIYQTILSKIAFPQGIKLLNVL